MEIQQKNWKEKIADIYTKIFKGKNARRNIVVLLLFVSAFGFVYYKYFGTKVVTTYEYATVTKKDIKKTVEGSGKVVSVSELDIQQLQNGGKVTGVRVKPGDYVTAGQIIATLDNRSASIQLAQARANYDKVVNGGNTPEDLAVANQSILNAKQSYDIVKQQQDTAVANARRTLLNTNIAAIPVYDSRISANTPTISGSYTCSQDANYNIKFATNDFITVNATGDSFNSQVRISSVPQALGNCGLFINFDLTKDYSNGEWNVNLPNQISTSYSTNLNAYNTALQNRDIALQNASTSIVNAQLAYNQKIAPPSASDLQSANASLQTANLNYDNTIVRAPFAGQIGSVSAAVGQQTNSQAGVATIITKDKIAQISLNEIDIVNVKLGQPVELTFDAIPGETFIGQVAQIDTIGAVTSNVVSFATKISIPNADERIKSGMSVTANIIIEKKDQVLSVPSATIKTETVRGEERSYVMKKIDGVATVQNFGGGNFASSSMASTSDFRNFRNGSTSSSTRGNFGKRNVAVATTGENIKVYVTVGLSDDVNTEIVEGLNENEMVVSKTIDGSSPTAKTTTTFSLFGGGGARAGGTGGATRPATR